MENNKLLIYLKNVLELEKHKYETEQLINYFYKNQYVHKEIAAKKVQKPSYLSVISNSVGFGVFFLVLGAFLAAASETMKNLLMVENIAETECPNFFLCPIIGAIVGFVIAVCYNYGKYESYGKMLKQSEQEASNINNQNLNITKDKNNILSMSISEIKSIYDDTEETLWKVYSLNVIHPKYRNLIAISSIYEYFDTGRCSSLEGAGGAYDTFEVELRLARIINKLDVIISQLEQIKTNQYMLYNALQESNNHIRNLTDTVSKHTEQLNQIAVNTAITNYRLKVIEDNQFYKRNIDTTWLI